jgi:hypothetical protein
MRSRNARAKASLLSCIDERQVAGMCRFMSVNVLPVTLDLKAAEFRPK